MEETVLELALGAIYFAVTSALSDQEAAYANELLFKIAESSEPDVRVILEMIAARAVLVAHADDEPTRGPAPTRPHLKLVGA